ncbi:MAG TPA: HAD-IIA family hydrolase [Mycobacteriales bacterium]|nr:HAD-IIA family hydrolase [Mycobacteriales bacterium]
MTAALGGCETAPAEAYDVALLDLDGVVNVGDEAAPHAIDALNKARGLGLRMACLTNNASRSATQVAERLRALGIEVADHDVVTSAQAAARLLAERLEPSSSVLVAGAAALRDEVTSAGLRVVTDADANPAAVVMGYDPTIDYPRLAEACVAIRRGALFVASNLDATLPTPRGPLPGMGSLAALMITATGVQPVVAGKPERPLFDESVERTGARRPLVVGDRLDTDIAGARNAGLAAMAVLTGVTDLLALASARHAQRPDLVAADLRGLTEAHPSAADGRSGDAVAEYDESAQGIVVRTRGTDAETLAAIVTAGWQAIDAGREVQSVARLRIG